jgi:hypothetical protein
MPYFRPYAVLPAFIAEYNGKFALLPEPVDSVFVPMEANDHFDALLAVCYERTCGNCGCFSFQKFTFQVANDKSIAKKKI